MVNPRGGVTIYLSYDEAVQVGLNAYRTLEYASSCLSAFRVASRKFREYLEDNDLSYSPELVQQWINDSKKYWNHSKLKCSKKALSVLADIMDHGVITTSLQTKSQRATLQSTAKLEQHITGQLSCDIKLLLWDFVSDSDKKRLCTFLYIFRTCRSNPTF